MGIYKIKNITNLLNKRHLKFKSVLDIDYVDEMMNKTLKLGVGQTKYMNFIQKPISLQKLAMEGLVSVCEVSKKEVITFKPKTQPKSKPQLVKPAKKYTPRKAKNQQQKNT